MKLMVVLALFLTLQPVSATGSAEERFFSALLMSARRGDLASFTALVHPEVFAGQTNSMHRLHEGLKEWARGIIHAEIMSISVLADGTVRLTTRMTRKTPQGLKTETLILDTVPGCDGLPRLLRSTPPILR
ncbi:MAG TPA: hypothetical protein PLM00_06160 [Spirochaetota bacterium]|nr:hypothetical protein [Spirochaetota bacterium]HPN82957.1 hypothetical protein [Spirochaetota bacterium]